MATIKSNIPLNYNSEKGSKAIIYIEVIGWYLNLKSLRYKAVLEHYKLDDKSSRVIIEQKHSNYHNLEVDGLFRHLKNDVLTSESYTDETINLITESLLFEIQITLYNGKCAYLSEPENWEIEKS
jgi:hypothetical protein